MWPLSFRGLGLVDDSLQVHGNSPLPFPFVRGFEKGEDLDRLGRADGWLAGFEELRDFDGHSFIAHVLALGGDPVFTLWGECGNGFRWDPVDRHSLMGTSVSDEGAAKRQKVLPGCMVGKSLRNPLHRYAGRKEPGRLLDVSVGLHYSEKIDPRDASQGNCAITGVGCQRVGDSLPK